MSTTDAAKLLGVSRQRIGQMLQAGELDGRRFGSRGWQVSSESAHARAHASGTGGRPWSSDTIRDVVQALTTGRAVSARAGDIIRTMDVEALWRRAAAGVKARTFVTARLDRIQEHLALTGESAMSVALDEQLVGTERSLHGYVSGVRLSQLSDIAFLIPVEDLDDAGASAIAGGRGGLVTLYTMKSGSSDWVTAPVAQRALVAFDCARSTTARVNAAGVRALTEMRDEWRQKNTS